MPGSTLIDFPIAQNRDAVRAYADPDAALWRRQYRARYPTEIVALKCMDGRLHLPLMTNTPVGIIHSFRNIGGKFDLGWPYFGLLLQRWVDTAIGRGHDAVILVTYHYAQGDERRGCAGWGYDTAAARADAFAIKAQCERVFGMGHAVVYPVVIGIETDQDAFIVHGESGETLELAGVKDVDADALRRRLRTLFTDMKAQTIEDLLPLLLGNLAHIAEVRRAGRTLTAASHMERIMGIGNGFEWLHLINRALLIGPYSYDLREPVAKAAGILLGNLESGRIPREDGVVVMTSATYRDETGTERLASVERAYSFVRLASETIAASVPALIPYVSYLVGTLDSKTREYHRLPFEG